MFSSDTQTSLSNSLQKRKKSDQENSPFKTVGIQSENPLLRRPPFRSGRVQEEAQKFLSIPEENTKNIKRDDHSVQLTNTSSISNLSSRSKKSKSTKSSFSQNSSKSRAKSKTSSADNSSNNNSIFDSSKLLKQPTQSKNFNLDFDSRWEYFLEMKTLDDATKRIYNSAFFQMWKSIYQKRYMQKAEEQASQIESTLDRFNSSHLYKNKNTNSFSNSYNTSRQNSSYEIDSRINRRSGLSNNYSFNSFQDSSEARVERMQQKYRKNYSNFDYSNNNVNDKSFRNYNAINNDSYLNENNIKEKSNNDIYNNNKSFNDMKEYYDKFMSNTNKNSYNDRVYNNNYEYNNIDDFNYRNINNNNESFRNNSGNNNSFNNYRKNDRNINEHFHDENHFDLNHLRSSNSPMKVDASASIKPIPNAQTDPQKIKKEEIIHQSQSYDPSISKELIEEIEGRISGQNEKEIALHFASQLNTIAKFNNTLNEYNNKNRRNSFIEEEDDDETQSNSLEKLDKNEGNQTQSNQINIRNNNNDINQEETDFNNLNDSNDFIEIPENQIESNKQFNKNKIQQSTQKKTIFANTLHKENDSQNVNMINENYTNKQNSLDINQENQNDFIFGDQYQNKKAVDKYDKYIEKITNSSSVNNEDDDDDDLLNYLRAQRQNFQPNSGKNRISNSEYQPVSMPNFVSSNNISKSTVTLEKLLKQNEIQVDTNLNNDTIRQANASRIPSVLSKTTIGFNKINSDSDSDQIDLSGVQFYHVSQAENAKFSNSNLSGIRQSKSANVLNKKLSNLEQYETIQNEKEEEESNESDSSSVPSRQREKSKKNSQKLTQELSNNATKGMQENDDVANETDIKSSFNSKQNTMSRSSSRRKRSATISGISPILKKNIDQIKQASEYNKSINKQQIKQIDDKEYNSQDEQLNEFNINKRNKQESQIKSSQKQQTNQINNSQIRYQIDQTNENNGLNKNKQTNQIKSIENDQTNERNKLSKNKQTDQIESIESDQTNEFSIKNGSRFENNKINNLSSSSASNRKTYTSSELTEISKRNLISREENYSESENEAYQRNVTRISDSIYFDDQQFFNEKDFNQLNSAENNKRAELSSLYDEEEFKKMEENSHFYSPLLKTFPGDLYDDVFTTGSERRKEYLSKTKLASIINFFSLKENEENKDD